MTTRHVAVNFSSQVGAVSGLWVQANARPFNDAGFFNAADQVRDTVLDPAGVEIGVQPPPARPTLEKCRKKGLRKKMLRAYFARITEQAGSILGRRMDEMAARYAGPATLEGAKPEQLYVLAEKHGLLPMDSVQKLNEAAAAHLYNQMDRARIDLGTLLDAYVGYRSEGLSGDDINARLSELGAAKLVNFSSFGKEIRRSVDISSHLLRALWLGQTYLPPQRLHSLGASHYLKASKLTDGILTHLEAPHGNTTQVYTIRGFNPRAGKTVKVRMPNIRHWHGALKGAAAGDCSSMPPYTKECELDRDPQICMTIIEDLARLPWHKRWAELWSMGVSPVRYVGRWGEIRRRVG